MDGREIPYIVSGSGGFAATRPQGGAPPVPWTKGEYTLVNDPIVDFGYLTVTVDATGDPQTLTIAFQSPTAGDRATVNLATGKLVASGG